MALKCAQCGTENPDDAYFCSKCGAQVWSAFDRPAGPTSLSPEAPAAPVQPVSPNRIAPPPPPSADSAFLIDQAPTPPAAAPVVPAPPASAYAPQDYTPYQAPVAVPMATGYGYAPLPPDGNTSGMGAAYPAPPETQGWTFAGCIPFGIFGFVNGSSLWGAIGLGGSFIGILGWVYAIWVGIKGKEIAWQSRRFDSIAQFEDTMRA